MVFLLYLLSTLVVLHLAFPVFLIALKMFPVAQSEDPVAGFFLSIRGSQFPWFYFLILTW